MNEARDFLFINNVTWILFKGKIILRWSLGMTINELKTIVDRFEGDYAVLNHHGEQIFWPKDKVPDDIKEGDVLVLTAKKEEDALKDREELAKTVINELLKRD